MIDINLFDQWVAAHDDDTEASELVRVVADTVILTEALLGHDVANAVARQVIEAGIESAYGTMDVEEALGHLNTGDPVTAIEALFTEVDLLNFRFAQQTNALKCYAMTGMIEDEDPAATYDDKRNHLSNLIEWGLAICGMVPEQGKALPQFRSICAAAQARFSIDLEHPVDTSAFAQLASLFRDGTADQVRKTLQNQISAKQLSVNARRELLPESALSFLKGTRGFPSIWMLSEQTTTDEEEVREPTFIPVCPATFTKGERPFVPSERHVDGYRVGAGGSAKTFDDYWEALDWLAQHRDPAFQPVGYDSPARCKPEWARVDRKLLLNELTATPEPAGDGAPKSLTEQVHLRLLRNPSVRVHPLGHTSKLYRYQFGNGIELALEKRIGEPWLYLRLDAAPPVESVDNDDVPGSKQGRHSNLNALPTFADQPLRKYKLTSAAALDAVLGRLR